ncbi:MAG: hypothetical protein QM673_11970 [Gordonia sp. (in: high G+C Gram-positive bacteria)]
MTPGLRTTGLRATGLGLVLGALLTACTVGGHPVGGSADLSAHSVTAADFPLSGATRVPQTSVKFALGDLIGRPVDAPYNPPECAPAAVSAQGAVIYVVIDTARRASFTTAVTGVDHDLGAVISRAARCPRTVTGDSASATTHIQTQARPAPSGGPGISTGAILRTEQTGDAASPLLTRTYTLIGQRGDIRVYVQYRWPSAGDIPADQKTQLDTLFATALARAFG